MYELSWGNAEGMLGWAMIDKEEESLQVSLVYEGPCGYPLTFHALPAATMDCQGLFHIQEDGGEARTLIEARPTQAVATLDAHEEELSWGSFVTHPVRVDFSIGAVGGVNPPDGVVYHFADDLCAPPRIDRVDIDGLVEKRWALQGARCGGEVLGAAPAEIPEDILALADLEILVSAVRICDQPPLVVGPPGVPVDAFGASCPATMFSQRVNAYASANITFRLDWQASSEVAEHTLQVGTQFVSGAAPPIWLNVTFAQLEAAESVSAYALARDDISPYKITAQYQMPHLEGYSFGPLRIQ